MAMLSPRSDWKIIPSQQHEDYIKEVLYRCIRLAYYERITESVSTDVIGRLPFPEKEQIIFTYEHQIEGREAGYELYQKMEKKDSEDTLLLWMESESGPMFNLSNLSKSDILITCLLQAGHKSFSHLIISIERYINLLRKYINDYTTAIQAITSVVTFYKTAPQRIIITLNKFVTFRVIPPSAIVEWLFSDDVLPLLRKQWVWELLCMGIDSTIDTLHLLQKKLLETENPDENFNSTEQERYLYTKLKINISAVEQEQKELFLILFQRFEMILKNYSDRKDVEDKLVDPTEKISTDVQIFKSATDTEEVVMQDVVPSGDTQEVKDKASYINKYTYRILLGVFKLVGRKYYKYLLSSSDTLDILLSQTDPVISTVYQSWKSVMTYYFSNK